MTTARPVRLGLLSAAHDHAHFWAEAFREAPGTTLVGIWDDDAERGEAAAARHGTRYVDDLEALLRDVDGVGITAETVRHAPLVEAAAAAGVHVLCEKPVAATLEDCVRIRGAVTAAGIVYLQSFPKRFDPAHQELVALARSGALGRIALVRVRHGHALGLDPAFRRRWYCDPALAGGGALLDEGIHAADFLRWLLGDPQRAVAATARSTLGLLVDDTALAAFDYADGALAEIAAGWSFVAAEQSIEVFGTEGGAMLAGVDLASRDFARAPYLCWYRRGAEPRAWTGSPTTPILQQGRTHHQAPRRFVECLRSGEPPEPGLDEAEGALRLILAAYRAAETGQAQPVSAIEPAGESRSVRGTTRATRDPGR